MGQQFLYDGLSKKELYDVLSCFGARIKKFSAGETVDIFTKSEERDRDIGILISGVLQISHCDSDGEMYFTRIYEGEGVFGESFFNVTGDDYYVVSAAADSEIAYTDFERISEFCGNVCSMHVRFTRNIYRIIAEQSSKDSVRLGFLSKKTLREKLLAYFTELSQNEGSREFNINISLTELSKYLCVDRSAMMREMKKMRDEGIILSKGPHITLL